MWAFATLALVSTISDTSTGEKSWGVLKESVHALSYIPGLLPTIGGASNDDHNDDAQAGFTRGLHTVNEKNRALKAASDDDTKKDDASGVGAGGGDAEDISAASDDDLGTTILDHMEASNKTSILPPEPEEQPREWPATVLVIFLVLAALLLVVTGVRNCRKKSQYAEVPATSLIV